MEIVLEVTQSPAGRLSGTVRAAGQTGEVAFSGVMDLLACVEELCAREATGPLPSRPATQDEAPGAWPGQPATAEERKFSHVRKV
jgi:hypothetical protein